jgi:UDP-glucose 4-epimerase
MKNKRIAILGGGGFIGHALIEKLSLDGHELVLISRKGSKVKYDKKHKLILYSEVGDNIFQNTDIVCDTFINLAWKGVSGANRNDEDQIAYNIPLTMWSVELANTINCKHWIGFGSQAEYGNTNTKLSEDMPINPTTLYGFAKVSSSYAALGLCQSCGITGTWVRLFDPYGPGDASHWFIPFLIDSFLDNKQPSLTKCEQLWDYLYIDDAVEAIVALVAHKSEGFFNLGSGKATPLKDIVEHIKKLTKSHADPLYGDVEYRDDQVMHLQASIEKISQQTNWTPAVDIYDGLKETVRQIMKESKK